MKHLLARGTAAVVIVATALTAACSNNDPTAPAAPRATRTPSGGPVHGGYVVAWGKDGGDPTNGGSAGTSTGTPTNGGSTVGGGAQGGVGRGKTGGTTGGASTTGGYVVAWGRDGGDSDQPRSGTN